MHQGRWLFLICMSRVGFALINTVYAALMPSLRVDWAMSASEAGLVQSAWYGGYVVSLVLASQLSGRYGARRTFVAMSYAAAASALLFALAAHDFRSAFLFYGLAGICAGGSYVPGLSLIAEQVAPAMRGRAMGWYIAAASLGYALSLVGASWLALWLSPRAGFLLAAAGAVLGVLLSGLALRTTPNVLPTHRAAPFWRSMFWLWRQRPARYVIFAYALHAWELLGMWAWLPSFLAYAMSGLAGWSASALAGGAMLAALTHVLSSAGSLCGGSWSDRWGRSRVMLAMSLGSLACALVFGWLLAAPWWCLVLVAVLFNFLAVGDSPIYSAALTEVVPARHLAAAYSLRSILGFGMGAVSPWLIGAVLDLCAGPAGALTDRGWQLAWMALAGVGLLGPLLSYRLLRLERQRR